jgi:adenylate kinase family enzyme
VNRVAIIGSGGAGKSTLARRLGAITGLPVIHLDAEHWLPGWVEPPREEWRERVVTLAAQDDWIIDGNYGGTMNERLERADTIVFVDLPRTVCAWRAFKRSTLLRRQPRPDMAEGCEERVDFTFLKWIWDYPATRRPAILVMLREARDTGKTVVRLRSQRHVDRWLARVAREMADSSAREA